MGDEVAEGGVVLFESDAGDSGTIFSMFVMFKFEKVELDGTDDEKDIVSAFKMPKAAERAGLSSRNCSRTSSDAELLMVGELRRSNQ